MEVWKKQCLLAYLGYLPYSDIDDIWGDQSRKATEAFQSDFELMADGIFGNGTLSRILEVIYNHEAPGEMSDTCVSTGTKVEEPADDADGPIKTGTFWDWIKFFDREEFRCKCNGLYCNGFPAEPSEALVAAADKLREHFGKPVTISSGVRCASWNTIRGGVYNSRHLSGKAMDFSVSGAARTEVENYLGKLKTAGTIRYWYHIGNGWYHMDVA